MILFFSVWYQNFQHQKSLAVSERADRTPYDALINHQRDNTFPFLSLNDVCTNSARA